MEQAVEWTFDSLSKALGQKNGLTYGQARGSLRREWMYPSSEADEARDRGEDEDE